MSGPSNDLVDLRVDQSMSQHVEAPENEEALV